MKQFVSTVSKRLVVGHRTVGSKGCKMVSRETFHEFDPLRAGALRVTLFPVFYSLQSAVR